MRLTVLSVQVRILSALDFLTKQLELHGDSSGPRPMGLLHKIKKARQSVSIYTGQLDKHFLPCRRRGGGG